MKSYKLFLSVVVIFTILVMPCFAEEEADHDVIVVGGGISGLSAAFTLNRSGYDVLLLEKENTVGGRAIDGKRKGVHYAQGAEYLGKPEGDLARTIRRLHLRKVEIPGPMDAHYCEGEFYYGEDGVALNLIQDAGLDNFNRFVRLILDRYSDYEEIPELDMSSELAKLDSITARKWLRLNRIPENIIKAYNVTARGLFGASLDDISALCFIPEAAFDYEGFEPIHSVEDLDPYASAADREDTGAYTFMGGISAVTKAMANSMKKSVRCEATVTKVICRDDETFEVRGVDAKGKSFSETATSVVMAVPAPVALKIGDRVLTREQKRIMKKIPYSTYATVSFFSEKPIFEEAFDLAVPDGWTITDLYDSTWVQRHREGGSFDGKWVMTAYVGPENFRDNFPLVATNDELLEAVYSDLEQIFPDVRRKTSGHSIKRFPYAYPVMTPGAYGRLTRLHRITGKNGLFLAGDYMTYPTFESAFDSGSLAAEGVEEYLQR